MFCKNCGQAIKSEDKNCSYCGSEQNKRFEIKKLEEGQHADVDRDEISEFHIRPSEERRYKVKNNNTKKIDKYFAGVLIVCILILLAGNVGLIYKVTKLEQQSIQLKKDIKILNDELTDLKTANIQLKEFILQSQKQESDLENQEEIMEGTDIQNSQNENKENTK